jgi:RNA polymerase sigma-70 factor (ECF subfamily)
VTLDDQVQFALAIVLDRLSPAERTAFVLHDVFGFPFTAVGEMVGRTPTACRQLASRARRSIRADDALASPLAEVDQHQLLAERFIAACAGGDMAELIAVLDPDVVGEATFVGGALIGRVAGREEMAQRALIFLGPKSGRTLVPVPGTDGPVVLALDDDDRVVAVMRIEAAAGVVHRVSTVVAPPG